MKLNLLSVIWCLVTTLLALPADLSPVKTSLTERAIPAWQFYYDATSAQHQTNFNHWSSLGYRMISLSVYGQPPNHRYAAVWVQRSGPSYLAIHDASASALQSWFNAHHDAGYVPILITATGPEQDATFAAVMEQNPPGIFDLYLQCGLSPAQYYTELFNAQRNSLLLKSFTEYGSSAARRFCGIWSYTRFDKYTTHVDESYATYQATFNGEVTKPYFRPAYFSVSEDHLISSAFTNTDVGSWVARHGLTAAALQTEYVAQKAAGRYLIHLQGGGTGSSTHFAAIFAEKDIATLRN